MAQLEILVHRGCLSQLTVSGLAREIKADLPVWNIVVRQVAEEESRSLGIIVLPAFMLEGKIIATGVPKKDWLVARLRESEGDGGG